MRCVRLPAARCPDEGLQAAKEIRRRYPDIGVLILSHCRNRLRDGIARRQRGRGRLPSQGPGLPHLRLRRCCHRVAEHGTALDPAIVSRLVGRSRHDNPIDTLTARERDVLQLMAEGLSNSTIAARLFVTERAIEKHVTSIFGKLRLPADADAHRRVLAVLAFLHK
jgi:DNA-binding NarL/FixJ family response regulator